MPRRARASRTRSPTRFRYASSAGAAPRRVSEVSGVVGISPCRILFNAASAPHSTRKLRPWLLCWLKGLAYSLGIARNHLEVGLSGLVRLEAALLPIAQSADRDTKDLCELLLAEPDRPAHMLCKWDPSHALQLRFARRLSVRVAAGSG